MYGNFRNLLNATTLSLELEPFSVVACCTSKITESDSAEENIEESFPHQFQHQGEHSPLISVPWGQHNYVHNRYIAFVYYASYSVGKDFSGQLLWQ